MSTFCGTQPILLPLTGELEVNERMQEHRLRSSSQTGGVASWGSPDPTPSVSLVAPLPTERLSYWAAPGSAGATGSCHPEARRLSRNQWACAVVVALPSRPNRPATYAGKHHVGEMIDLGLKSFAAPDQTIEPSTAR